MLIQNKQIAVVGAGPGGLTLARLLQLKGANVKVYERDINKDVRVQGATLDLHNDSGLKALRAANLMDAFIANYRPGADKIRLMDNAATVHYDQHLEESTGSFGDEHFRPEIDRGPLRKILLESLEPDTVIWDCKFSSMLKDGNRWKLEFENGTAAIADLVVGADGANSKIRPFITPIKAFYSGITVVEGTIYDSEKTAKKIHELVNGGKIFAFSNEHSLIISSKGDGSLAFYTGCKTPQAWVTESGIDFKNNTEILKWFKKEYSDWDTVWQELFDNAKTQFTPRPQYCMPLDQTWEAHSNITIIGDAAHLMPPYAGEGVNMAMQDALELSECLCAPGFISLQEAIASYEIQMRARASETAKLTLDQTESLHSKNALRNMLNMFGLE